MARCTKEDALATRHRLLDAAEQVFSEKGVSGTSLNDIAQSAGVSRGAIYWHFKNKADLFNALMERIILPMDEKLQKIGDDYGLDPLDHLLSAIMNTMSRIESDESTRRVFEVVTLKVEYVNELLTAKMRRLKNQTDVMLQIQHSLLDASKRQELTTPFSLEVATHGLHALVIGLVHSWLLNPLAFRLVITAEMAIKTYLKGLGLAVRPARNSIER